MTPTNTEVVPGVLSWAEYQKRLATWDEVRQCIGLRAQFWEGRESLLFPPLWLNTSEERARALVGYQRKAMALGCDPGEGGDPTAWAVVDERGLLDLETLATPDTAVIPNHTLALMRKWNIPAERVLFDRGGGGYQHACTLNERGYGVRSIGFGEGLEPEPKRGKRPLHERREVKAERYTYLNRRAQMYGQLSVLLDPDLQGSDNTLLPGFSGPFALPGQFHELRRQLAKIPRLYDGEGRLYLPPKRPRPGTRQKSLLEIIGRSPDEADAVVLALHALIHELVTRVAGAFG